MKGMGFSIGVYFVQFSGVRWGRISRHGAGWFLELASEKFPDSCLDEADYMHY